MKKRVCILMGSPRKNGNTMQLLQLFMQQLQQSGCECELIWLYDKNIQPCRACRCCQKDHSIFGCAIRDDMPEFYRHCQAVIHPSYHEGMSNVLQEAAATARPVIASDINGCREIFENGVSGLAFLPQNADSLTEAVEKFLLLTPEERAEMGRQARAYVEAHFDRRQVVTAYLETLGSLIGATRC